MFEQLVMNSLIAGGIYAQIVLSFSVIYRTVIFFHLAHSIIYTTAVYVVYTLSIQLRMGFIPAFFLSILVAAVLGILIERNLYLPLQKRRV